MSVVKIGDLIEFLYYDTWRSGIIVDTDVANDAGILFFLAYAPGHHPYMPNQVFYHGYQDKAYYNQHSLPKVIAQSEF